MAMLGSAWLGVAGHGLGERVGTIPGPLAVSNQLKEER